MFGNRFPTDSDWSNKWEKRIKEFDPTFRRKSNDIVCSLHFAKASMKPVSRQLVDHALPIYFPNTKQDEPQTQKKLPMKASVETKCVKPVPDSTSSDSMCCIVGCRTKFDESDPRIHGFRYELFPNIFLSFIIILQEEWHLFDDRKIFRQYSFTW